MEAFSITESRGIVQRAFRSQGVCGSVSLARAFPAPSTILKRLRFFVCPNNLFEFFSALVQFL